MARRLAWMTVWAITGATAPASSARQAHGLPELELLVAGSVLAALDADPMASTRYPARLVSGGDTLDVEVRYRGSSSRTYAKKSWKVVFGDTGNPFGASEINLNAEFNDRTLMRNAVNMGLFAWLGFPVPATEHVWLGLNGVPQGVYVRTEQVDRRFFEARGIEVDALFKSVHWTATLAPNLVDERFDGIYERKDGDRQAEHDLKALLSASWSADDDEFVPFVGAMLDLEALVAYEAGNILIVNRDAFSKNYYLYRSTGTGRFSLVPWDMDGTLGQDWTGELDPSLASWSAVHSLYMVPFQRLMQRSVYTGLMNDLLASAVETAFPLMIHRVDSIEARISSAVAADPYLGDGAPFSESVQVIRTFLQSRAAFLPGWLPYPVRPPRPRWSADGSGDGRFTFTVSGVPREVSTVDVVVGLDLDLDAGTLASRSFTLPYVGPDAETGLDTYRGVLDLSGALPQAAPLMVLYDGTVRWPENGFVDVAHRPQASPALRIPGGDESRLAAVAIGDASPSPALRLLKLVNGSGESIDLSWLRLAGPDPGQIFTLPPATSLMPGGSLWLTDDPVVARAYAGVDPVLGGLTLRVAAGDSVTVLSPLGTPLFSRLIGSAAVTPAASPVVINEINYNSAGDVDPGDWVELFNAGTSDVAIESWVLSDDRDDHRYRLPAGTTIRSGGYLVLATDPGRFAGVHPDVPAVGPVGFGFSAQGDAVRLIDSSGTLLDVVAYDDADPWPAGADGEGYTMELLEPGCDNAIAACWARSATLYGSPGARNLATGTEPAVPPGTPAIALFPNPASDRVDVRGLDAGARVDVYDVLGRPVGRSAAADAGTGLSLDLGGLATGLYFVRVLWADGALTLPVVKSR